MKKVWKTVLCVVTLTVCANAIEFKQGVTLPPVDGSVFNGSVWIVK